MPTGWTLANERSQEDGSDNLEQYYGDLSGYQEQGDGSDNFEQYYGDLSGHQEQGDGSDNLEQYHGDLSGYRDQDQDLSVSSSTSTPINKSHGGGWKSIAKFGIQALKESSDVLPLLKSVVGGLAFFLSTYEVRFV